MAFNNIFELLTIGADISQFISLKKTYDNHNQLDLMHKLDKIDDEIFNTLITNQENIIKLLGVLIMYIKKMMDKIVESGTKSDMDYLGEMFVDMVYNLKEKDHMKYKSIEYEMHKIAYGEHLTEEQAKCWVYKMKNKDGTTGEHWTWEQTEEVRKQYAPALNCADFYAILNMVYSDFYSSKFDTATYIELAKDWLNDEDIATGKALRYYMFVVE